ncbi:unnamed protein product [Mesocestoides corti]|uniref:Uncharacterized protein n=1 Tax=Mesocestoides corti TaxID=53468 RepID=A0A3P6GVP0_MESCO|nr:unnamed protein product [Mesocestoides corti]
MGLYYTIRTGSNEVFLQVVSRWLKLHLAEVVQQRLYADVEEDTVYLQLLLITVASLVLVVFVVSIIFSCWWIKSRQESLDTGSYYVDATEMETAYSRVRFKLLLISQPECKTDSRVDGNGVESVDAEIELISLGQNPYSNEGAGTRALTGGEYTTFASLAEELSAARSGLSSSDPHSALPGVTHTLPRYTIAGNNGTSSGSGGGAAVPLGVPPSVLSPAIASTSSTFGASLPRMPAFERTAIPVGMKIGLASTTGRTRHVAKEFLDESVLNVASRRLKPTTDQTSLRRPPLSNLVATPSSTQQVVLVPAVSGSATTADQAFLLASAADGVMRPLSPIGVVETLGPSALVSGQLVNPCEIHPIAVSTPTGALLVQVDPTQSPTATSDVSVFQHHSPTLRAAAGAPVGGMPILAGDLLAEMAACPQHSYLVRQQIDSTFETSPPISVAPVETIGTAAAVSSVASQLNEETLVGAPSTLTHDPPDPPVSDPQPGAEIPANPPDDSSQISTKIPPPITRRQASAGCSETLPRSMGRSGSHTDSVDSDLNRPGSSATLPAGSGSGSARKSALKGPGGSKVSKQIRFTFLNLVAISCVVTVAMASSVLTDSEADGASVHGVNVIKFPSPTPNTTASASERVDARHTTGAFLRVTLWIPDYFALGGEASKRLQGLDNSTLRRKPPASIQLWLNRTSRTEVHLGPNVHRSAVEIYEVGSGRDRQVPAEVTFIFFPPHKSIESRHSFTLQAPPRQVGTPSHPLASTQAKTSLRHVVVCPRVADVVQCVISERLACFKDLTSAMAADDDYAKMELWNLEIIFAVAATPVIDLVSLGRARVVIVGLKARVPRTATPLWPLHQLAWVWGRVQPSRFMSHKSPAPTTGVIYGLFQLDAGTKCKLTLACSRLDTQPDLLPPGPNSPDTFHWQFYSRLEDQSFTVYGSQFS